MRKLFALAAVAVLAGCIPSAPPPVAPAPRPTPTPTPTPTPVTPALTGDWRDWPLTPGDWSYVPTQYGSSAVFGTSGNARFIIECDRATNRVRVFRQEPIAGAMTIRTTSATRTLQTDLAGHPPAAAGVALTPRDSLLDAMGYSRGRFIVEQPGLPTLVIPAYAEIERVAEDCRA